MADAGNIIIDPPVTRYSSVEDIEQWLKELRAMDQTPEVRQEIDRTIAMLADAEAEQNPEGETT